MAILYPTITQTVTGQVTITCPGCKNTYIDNSITSNRIGTVKGTGGDTSYRGDTTAPYPAFAATSTIVTTAGARPLVGVGNLVRIGDSVTTVTVDSGAGIFIYGYAPNGNMLYSTDSGSPTGGGGNCYIVW
jgi:hypothetical protein